MTRSNAREIAIHLIYEMTLRDMTADELFSAELTQECFDSRGEEESLYESFPDDSQRSYIETLVQGVYTHREELDDYISRLSIGWKLSRLPRVAAAILRAAMYEVKYMEDVPNAAAVNEAVEIAKKYEDPEVVSFINGILGTFIRQELSPVQQSSHEEQTAGAQPCEAGTVPDQEAP